jgi:hypothetical protein
MGIYPQSHAITASILETRNAPRKEADVIVTARQRDAK